MKDRKGVVVDHIVTAANGIAKTKGLPIGSYTIIETKAPIGYRLDAAPIAIVGKLDDEVVTVMIPNEKVISTEKANPPQVKNKQEIRQPISKEKIELLPDTGSTQKDDTVFVGPLLFIFLVCILISASFIKTK